jgi:hypothetical protein
MAISRSQLVKELEPGLNALFGLEYNRYENQHAEIFATESSDRAFEEEVMLSGFGSAPIKQEGASVVYDQAQETFTARYTHQTIALAFSITEEAIEDNLYDRLAARYTRALARSMSNTKQVKAAQVLNQAQFTAVVGGDGVSLINNAQSLIDIASFVDERGLKIALSGRKMIIPKELQFTAERLMKSPQRVGTADNDINAIVNMGMVPEGYRINNFLTDTDSFFLLTDVPNGLKMFVRSPIKTAMEGDFETGNVRFKARERYSFGFSDPRCIFGNGNLPTS